MALKAKIANQAVLDRNGYCSGTIESILEVEERVEKIGRKSIKYAAQFEFVIKSNGSHKPIIFRFWTGQNLNCVKFQNEDKVDYNRLTRLLINLGLILESDLEYDLADSKLPDLESLEGREVRFKLEPSKNSKSLQIPDISTIQLV
jgi:hypothetical protein